MHLTLPPFDWDVTYQQIPQDTVNILIYNNWTSEAKVAEGGDDEVVHAQPIMLKGKQAFEEALHEFEELVADIVEEELGWESIVM